MIFDILIMCIHVLFRYMGKRINLHSVNQISLHCLRRMDGCHSLSPFPCFSLSALFLSFQGMRISRKMSLMWVTMSDRSSCTSRLPIWLILALFSETEMGSETQIDTHKQVFKIGDYCQFMLHR